MNCGGEIVVFTLEVFIHRQNVTETNGLFIAAYFIRTISWKKKKKKQKSILFTKCPTTFKVKTCAQQYGEKYCHWLLKHIQHGKHTDLHGLDVLTSGWNTRYLLLSFTVTVWVDDRKEVEVYFHARRSEFETRTNVKNNTSGLLFCWTRNSSTLTVAWQRFQ